MLDADIGTLPFWYAAAVCISTAGYNGGYSKYIYGWGARITPHIHVLRPNQLLMLGPACGRSKSVLSCASCFA